MVEHRGNGAMFQDKSKNANNNDPFAWEPSDAAVVTGNVVHAWWLERKGYECIGKIKRPYTGLFGQINERVHYYFKIA